MQANTAKIQQHGSAPARHATRAVSPGQISQESRRQAAKSHDQRARHPARAFAMADGCATARPRRQRIGTISQNRANMKRRKRRTATDRRDLSSRSIPRLSPSPRGMGRLERLCRLWSPYRSPGDLRMSRHIVCLTFDHDHLSGFIARGQTTPTAISRGEYDVVVIPRLVALLERYGIKATFFTPGHTIDCTPQAVMPYVEAATNLPITAGRIACPPRCRARRKKRKSSAAMNGSSASAASLREAIARRPGTSPRIRSSCCRSTASSTTAR